MIKSLRDTLVADGHDVTTADGGQAGIDAFLAAAGQGQAFPVVITDLGMPYVDGRKVSSAIKAAAPGTTVMLLTGWGQRLVAEGEIPPHVDRVLSKPPKLRALREALARFAAEQEDRLFAQQVPRPPREIDLQRVAKTVQGGAGLDMCVEIVG